MSMTSQPKYTSLFQFSQEYANRRKDHFPQIKAIECYHQEKEFVRLAELAVHDKQARDEACMQVLAPIKRCTDDEPPTGYCRRS
jgi:mevalonate pyrophosphate decarboxylase